MTDTPETEVVEGEVVVATLYTGAQPRQLRVYDPRGDFLVEIPEKSRVTFSYFNPAASGAMNTGGGSRGYDTMKTTALRIYSGTTEKGPQIACFLGATGFRDTTAVKLTRLKQRVTIESNFEDDGLGETATHERAMRQLVSADEDVF